jgi:hypothetical protein
MAALVLAVVSNYEKRMADGTVRSSGERCVSRPAMAQML